MRKLVLAAVFVLMANGAQAATLNVIGGQLMGASDVLVDGNLYGVQFLDGTCIDLYSGCDEASDFTFQSNAAATLASQALLDQVLLGVFDEQPELTNGCSEEPAGCSLMTPFNVQDSLLSPPGNFPAYVDGWAVSWVDATNISGAGFNYGVGDGVLPVDSLYSIEANGVVWAVWSSIPEPSTALLLGLGLVGIAARRRA